MKKIKYKINFFAVLLMFSTTAYTHSSPTPSAGYVMEIHMTPAICDLDQYKAQKRKCKEGYSLNIGGLYPFQYHSACKTKDVLKLPLLQTKVISRLIPDEQSRLKLWQKVGGCIGVSEQQYFRMISSYARDLKIPMSLSNANTQMIQLSKIKSTFLQLNPKLSARAFHFECQAYQDKVYLSSIKVCYQLDGTYQNCPVSIQDDCPSKFMIKGTH